MEQAQGLEQIGTYQNELVGLLNSKVLNHFIMVLEARRAIECETAKLAAQFITDRELDKLKKLEKKREQDYSKGIISAKPDIDIHKMIAEASRNKVFIALILMIDVLHQQSDVFDYMLRRMKKPAFISHKKLIDALESRDPSKAKKCMLNHVNSLIKDVKN